MTSQSQSLLLLALIAPTTSHLAFLARLGSYSRTTTRLKRMPSHPRSPLPRPPPLLPPLSTTTSPTYSPLASPLDERRPLLRTARSFGADDLRRRSHQFSDLLFRHGDRDAQAGPGGLEEAFDGADGVERGADDEGERRGLARARSSFFGSRRGSLSRLRTGGGGYDGEFKAELEGEAGNGVRSWYGALCSSLRSGREDD